MLDTIAKALREKRFAAGAINFDRYEVKFEIDEKGKPISVYFKESKDANKLVEEFMLLANRTVAEKVGRVPKNKKAKVLPYRIHDLPDPEKLENLSQFIARFGYKVRTSGTKTDISKSINHLLDDIHGKKEENLIETVSIRAMQKARYSTHNIGHYGLAFDYYTHFTSPHSHYPVPSTSPLALNTEPHSHSQFPSTSPLTPHPKSRYTKSPQSTLFLSGYSPTLLR